MTHFSKDLKDISRMMNVSCALAIMGDLHLEQESYLRVPLLPI
jgi:hypothetical protein